MFTRCIFIAMIGIEAARSSNFTFFWNYDDEANWPGELCKEGGRRQSPIDIRTEKVTKDLGNQFIKYGTLKFIGYDRVLLMGVNNGHTIQFSSEGDASMHPVVTGGPLKHNYRLEQIHFHWLSEHAVNGHKYPMEIHFVHVRSDLSVSRALTRRDGLSIISVFCNVQAVLADEQTERTSEIMNHIPHLLTNGARVSGVLLDLTKLLSVDRESYFTYAGSLTSPECNEVVIWIIFETPIFITDAQYRLFGKVGVLRHNFRSLQPVTDHVVYRPPPVSMWGKLYIVELFNDMASTVAGFFRNVTNFMHDVVNRNKS